MLFFKSKMIDCRLAELAGVHLNLERAKHSGRQFISENQRFTAGMLRPYEDICKNEMHPLAEDDRNNHHKNHRFAAVRAPSPDAEFAERLTAGVIASYID